VLPGEAEEVEAGHVGDAATVAQAAALVEDRQLDPRVVRSVTGRPDDGVDLAVAAVLEAHPATVGVNRARFQLDPIAPLELAWARADQRLPRAQALPETRFD